MQKDEIEKLVELVAHLAEVADVLKAEAIEKMERGNVFRIDAGDHGVFTQCVGAGYELFEQRGANALAAEVE